MTDPWLGAVEGYYGPPLQVAERLDLVRWLGAHGFNAYAYAPKDDPFHRQRWREPYPDDRQARFADLLATGTEAGVDVALVVSPGLDWSPGDEEHLLRKLESFAGLGATTLGVAFDDVPPGGAGLGSTHANAVRFAADRLDPGVRWVTCPTDYATGRVTEYLRAYHDGLPEGAEAMWTGPSIVSPKLDGGLARSLGEELGRPLLIAENYPVNDGAMGGVLHLGPYRGRSPDLPASTSGVFFNFMSLPRASRPALAAGARFWQDPAGDPQTVWRECLAEFPGLEPLARASRTWANDPAPDAEIAGLVRGAIDGNPDPLRAFLVAGCRAGLAPELAAEVEPWLEQWDAESLAMQFALMLLTAPPEEGAGGAFAVAEAWARARASRLQLFGTRWAHYPVTAHDGRRMVPLAEGLMLGSNLTDELVTAALERASQGAAPS
jgi:hypothetical protein